MACERGKRAWAVVVVGGAGRRPRSQRRRLRSVDPVSGARPLWSGRTTNGRRTLPLRARVTTLRVRRYLRSNVQTTRHGRPTTAPHGSKEENQPKAAARRDPSCRGGGKRGAVGLWATRIGRGAMQPVAGVSARPAPARQPATERRSALPAGGAPARCGRWWAWLGGERGVRCPANWGGAIGRLVVGLTVPHAGGLASCQTAMIARRGTPSG